MKIWHYNKKVQNALEQLTNACNNKEQNLLNLAVYAAEQRATLGEISDSLEKNLYDYRLRLRGPLSGDYINENSEHLRT